MFSQDRAELWHDETVHPGSTAMLLAMKAAEADLGLVEEWRQHCEENYPESDWITYAEYLEVELEITIDNLDNIRIHDAIRLANRTQTLLREIEKGAKPDKHVLDRRPTPKPPVPLDVRVSIPGSFTARVAVAEETVKLKGWTFMPHESDAGYFGPKTEVNDVLDSDGGTVSAPEAEGVRDFLNPHDTAGPFWRAVQTELAEGGGHIAVDWVE